MFSHFLAFEEPFYAHHRSNTMPIFNSEPFLFSALSDSSIDSLLQFSEEPNAAVGPTEAQSLEELAQMETLSLQQQAQFAHLQNPADFQNGFVDSPVSGVQFGFDSPTIANSYFSGVDSYTGETSMVNYLQRSYSHGSQLYDEQKPGNLFQPPFSSLSEISQFGGQAQMRRVLSTGDLPMNPTQTASPSNLGSRSTTSTIFTDEPSFKVAKYSAEERKEKIDRYRAKRSLRNFNKTIKYSCRKTLADSRPRIRGRFARNDEPVARAKSVEDEHLLVEGAIHGGDGDQRGHLMNNLGESSQFDHKFFKY